MPHVDNQVTEYMTDGELSRLLAVLDSWPFDDSAAFIKFALFTGSRRGELFKLQWNHVDFERVSCLTTTAAQYFQSAYRLKRQAPRWANLNPHQTNPTS